MYTGDFSFKDIGQNIFLNARGYFLIAFKKLTTLFCILFFSNFSFSQRYTFYNYNVENGLVQSQANAFCQDAQHHLWVSTIGGISKYDGNKFVNFTQSDGLPYNFSTCILADKKNNIWVGTASGLSRFDGKKFTNYFFSKVEIGNYILSMVEGRHGDIYVIAGRHLYKIHNNKVELVVVHEDKSAVPTAITADKDHNIWVALYKKGIFCLEDQGWVQKIGLTGPDQSFAIGKIIFKNDQQDTIYLLSQKDILEIVSGHIIKKKYFKGQIKGNFIAAAEDVFNNLWIGTDKGLYEITDEGLLHFTSMNGFADNEVNVIFRDHENNMWFGTNGAGIFRYSYDNFTIIDPSQGLASVLVSGIAAGKKNEVVIGTYGGGLYVFNNQKLQNVKIPSVGDRAQLITCLYKKKSGDILVGTNNGGLWDYDMNNFTRMDIWDSEIPGAINAIAEDPHGDYWMGGPYGLYFYSVAEKKAKALFNGYTNCVLQSGHDSVFVGTSKGLYFVNKNHILKKIDHPLITSTQILCLAQKDNFLFIGSENKGFIIWDLAKNKMTNCTNKDGLNSDFVYSLLIDRQGYIWAGTGRGINKIHFDYTTQHVNFYNYASSNYMTSAECSENTIL